MSKKVVIIGGVAGGASAAARLRRLDEQAEIILVERGEYISFANCGLPYFIGGVIEEKKDLLLQTPQSFGRRFNIDVRVESEALNIDPDKKTVKILNIKTGEEYIEGYDNLIISTGAEPIVPNIEGSRLENVFTLRNIPDVLKIHDYIKNHSPKTAAVIGGGYIGIEMAENLHRRGIKVSIIELSNQILPPLDYDMAAGLHSLIRSKGVDLSLKSPLQSIEKTSSGLKLNLPECGIDADMVIMSVGVRPESSLAGQAGLSVNQRGSIIVDKHMGTSDRNIYAVGDVAQIEHYVSGVAGFIPLAGPANKQGRIAADNICGLESEYQGTQGSSILKCFDYTIATTGLNEREAGAAGFDCEKSFTYSASHAGYYPGGSNMLIKIVFERGTGRVLGAQLIGKDGVDKRCDVFATAIRAGMTVKDLTNLELCYAPPYSSAKDPVNMAGYVAGNILDSLVKVIHWHDIESLDKNEYILLDVRTEAEYLRGTIDSSVNIPLDSLRNNLNVLDRSKKIAVFCQVGHRGYIASRILEQNGFEAYNLSGGYRLYSSIYNEDKHSSKLLDSCMSERHQSQKSE